MALTRTTLSSAVALTDTSIVVASATGFAANYVVRVDQEFMRVQQSYSSGTTIPVIRGVMGSKSSAHVVTAGVVVGISSDWDAPGYVPVNNPAAGRPRVITSITADNSTVSHAASGSDHVVVLNGTSVINLTVPVPTTDMDGDMLTIVANGAAAHVITYTGGLGGAGASYDVVTLNGTAPCAIQVVACNAKWMPIFAPAMGGTVTNLIGSIA